MTIRPDPIVGLGLRTSIGRIAAPALLLVVAADVALRGHPWRWEWNWAIYQLGFVTVFLGPLAAGLGAWEGRDLARQAPLVDASGARRRVLGLAWCGLAGWAAAAYVAAVATLVAVLAVTGTLDAPGWRALTPVPGVVAVVGAWAAIGLRLGFRWPQALTAPLAAIGAFGLTLLAFVDAPKLVQVGGATADLIGLELRPSIQLGQLAWFAGITGVALLGAAPGRGARASLAVVVAWAALVGSAAFLLADDGTPFRSVPVAVACAGTRPQVCVARPYRRRLHHIEPALRPYLHELHALGMRAPARFTQAPDPPAGVGRLGFDLVAGRRWPAGTLGTTPAGAAVVSALIPPTCDVTSSPATLAASDRVEAWALTVAHPALDPDAWLAADARPPRDPAARARWLRQAIAVLHRCR